MAMAFAKDFVWGAAISAYQIEGAVKGEGKGLHVWDVYTNEPGHVFENHTGEIACDHYHRYREFKAFAKALDEATQEDPRIKGVLSTKGSL